jgi:hypothetical protein
MAGAFFRPDPHWRDHRVEERGFGACRRHSGDRRVHRWQLPSGNQHTGGAGREARCSPGAMGKNPVSRVWRKV